VTLAVTTVLFEFLKEVRRRHAESTNRAEENGDTRLIRRIALDLRDRALLDPAIVRHGFLLQAAPFPPARKKSRRSFSTVAEW
jgi:hypothetical protein